MKIRLTFERQEICPVVATALREDANSTTMVEYGVHSVVYLSLIEFWCNEEVDALKSICNTFPS